MSRSLRKLAKNRDLRSLVEEIEVIIRDSQVLTDPIYVEEDFGIYKNDEDEYVIDRNFFTSDPDMYVSERLNLLCTEYQDAITESCDCHISYGNVVFKTEQDARAGLDWVISVLPMVKMRGRDL